jgi:hypothetical protein
LWARIGGAAGRVARCLRERRSAEEFIAAGARGEAAGRRASTADVARGWPRAQGSRPDLSRRRPRIRDSVTAKTTRTPGGCLDRGTSAEHDPGPQPPARMPPARVPNGEHQELQGRRPPRDACASAGSTLGRDGPALRVARRSPPGLARCRFSRRVQYHGSMDGSRTVASGADARRGFAVSFALLAQLVEHFHGKEGVAGSSPAEGSRKPRYSAVFLFQERLG